MDDKRIVVIVKVALDDAKFPDKSLKDKVSPESSDLEERTKDRNDSDPMFGGSGTGH